MQAKYTENLGAHIKRNLVAPLLWYLKIILKHWSFIFQNYVDLGQISAVLTL